jgi:dynein heavy chain 1
LHALFVRDDADMDDPRPLGEDPPSAVTTGTNVYETQPFKRYLGRLLPALLSATPADLDALFAQSDFEDKATRFGTDGALAALYINKIRIVPEEQDAGEGVSVDCTRRSSLARLRSASFFLDVSEQASFVFTLSAEMTYRPTHAATLALIKRHPTLDSMQPIGDQVHFLNLFGPAGSSLDNAASGGHGSSAAALAKSNPYESLHSLVHLAVAPYFEAYVNSKAGQKLAQEASSKSKDGDAKMGIPMTKKKLAELELSLLHLQQNVEIPDIHLVIHPVVQRTVDRCRAEGIRLSPEAVDPIFLSDSTFLNKIQGEVNSWIKEIQNVTKLNRNVASGTASQEINFWLSMEKALEDIEDQLRSEPIVLTLDILKHAKRFHATVSFIADTGLKEATDIGLFPLVTPNALRS